MIFSASLFKILKIPGVLLAAVSLIITSMSIGFLQATLEPHLRQVNKSSISYICMKIIKV